MELCTESWYQRFTEDLTHLPLGKWHILTFPHCEVQLMFYVKSNRLLFLKVLVLNQQYCQSALMSAYLWARRARSKDIWVFYIGYVIAEFTVSLPFSRSWGLSDLTFPKPDSRGRPLKDHLSLSFPPLLEYFTRVCSASDLPWKGFIGPLRLEDIVT